ncbi:DUF58 domain-containing protein [Ferrimonas lipolytica]|uniref:DUF58 domain-containing protein n=1 Tax=Ferrimonas lipolytica TaxID=2724191 RepID=A0A6H1UBN5_9GAMM|nr:DUF58 domain-containing protein [Ferrimonas lipolytica]QIZ76059.1 DUF58 domain-containing protein [Ferrimonas lipolytica]
MNIANAMWHKWLHKRLPPSRAQTLSHRSIFILPSGAGIAYLVMCMVLFILGTNYQNNLILALAFILLSLFHTSLLMAYRNLSGITLRAGKSNSCHAGEQASFTVELSAERYRHHIALGFANTTAQLTDVDNAHNSCCELPFPSTQRGKLNPGRIWIETRYPLGLCRAWSVQDLNLSALIWPTAIAGPTGLNSASNTDQNQPQQIRPGIEDFQGLERWQQGDSQSRVAWKQLAQTGSWQIKQFVEPIASPTILTLDSCCSIEDGLSHLTAQLLQHENNRQPYALKLQQQSIEADIGRTHLLQCLDALALYQEGK